MNKLILTIFFTLISSSCSNIQTNELQRRYQSEVIDKITQNKKKLSACAQKHNLYRDMNSSRVRVELIFRLSNSGQLEQFKTDARNYPTEFVNCLFDIVDKISFPRMNDDKSSAQFSQPIIFKN